MKILGIDPGTGRLGFGVIEVLRGKAKMITAGVVTTPAHTDLAERLVDIYESLGEIISETGATVCAIEKLFFSQNITTGISVAEARGVAMLICKQRGLEIFEYTPLQIKQTLTGYGRAEKGQVQEMVRLHLGLRGVPRPDDAADALGAAITCQLMRSA